MLASNLPQLTRCRARRCARSTDKRLNHRGAARSSFAGSYAAYNKTSCSASSRVSPISRAVASAMTTLPLAILRNWTLGCPCAVHGPPGGAGRQFQA